MPPVLVQIEHPTPRARHAVRAVLHDLLGWEVEFAADIVSFLTATGPRLFYGHAGHPGVFQVSPAGLLQGTGMLRSDPPMGIRNGLPLLFPVSGGDLPFDVFSAAFWSLTRMEEWNGIGLDEHGRPLSAELHAVRHGYLEHPVVDEWALMLADAWSDRDPAPPRPVRTYRQVVTMDLDNGFKYLGRPIWRNAGSAVRDLLHGRWRELPARLATLVGGATDPYDIYGELRGLLEPYADRTLFFVLAAQRGPMDHAVPIDDARYSARLRGLSRWASVGLHPSYASGGTSGAMEREKASLESVTGHTVTASRQHFLRLSIPATLRELERIGMTEEHSMGLHDRPGFRAGTCTPYMWYDLEQERTTSLRIHPFAVMDNTLRYKLHLPPEEAVPRVGPLVERVRAVAGTFTGLWHESFMGHDPSNQGWREAVLRIIENARS